MDYKLRRAIYAKVSKTYIHPYFFNFMKEPKEAFKPGWHRLVVGTAENPRTVWAPSDAMRNEHQVLLWELQELGIEFDYATGSIKGRNILQNALRHSANRYFFQVDIYNAYGQVDIGLLAAKLCQRGFYGEVEDTAAMLERLCKSPGGEGLAMGGPAVPMLFNIYCLDLDKELGAYCGGQGVTYTRYLDDLTFSSPDRGFPTQDAIGKHKRRAIKEIIARHKLTLSEHKTRVRDLMDGPVKITGVQINTQGKIQLPTSYLKAARLQLRQLLAGAPDIQVAFGYAAGLNGLINAVNDPERSMSGEEIALYLEVQDVLMMRGISSIPF